MDLQASQREGVDIVLIPGEHLDAGNSEEFKAAVNPLIEAGDKMVLDIGQLKFVDSSGLGSILSCLRKLTAKGGDLKVAGMTRQVRLLFELVRMHRIIDVYNDVDEAVAAFRR